MQFLVPLSVWVLVAAFVLIAIRQIGRFRLQIWQIILVGAAIVILTGQISLPAALSYINLTVIVFLIGIFIVGEALTESGYIQHLSYKLLRRARSVDALVLLVLFSTGFASMLLLNDTLAVIGTPVVLLFAARERINPKLLLLSLAFGVTIGSVASPIGNPQNLLIASSGIISNPFPAFVSYLFVPTVINLFIAYLVLRLFYKKEFRPDRLIHASIGIRDRRLAQLCKVSLALLIISIIANVVIVSLNIGLDFNLAYIAILSALPIVLFSSKRREIVKNIDWSTIVLFIALFVLVGSVWQSGFLQEVISTLNLDVNSVPIVLISSVIGSQLISNVPMVLLYLKLSSHLAVQAAIALAAGSTIAGNLFILGAASNVIIIQNAERRQHISISFMDFAKVGMILTALNIFVYWIFLGL